MRMNRRDALRTTGLAAGAALIPDAAAPAAGWTRPRDEKKRPWYELGLMADPVLDQVRRTGGEIRRKGHGRSAGETLMRAATYYRAALHRYPEPRRPDARRLARRAVDAYETAIELLELPVRRVRIPYERTTLPGYLFHARGRNGRPLRRAPLLIADNGRDAWAQDGRYLAEAANERGCHCLLFDGPGQGSTMRLQGLPFRPDWERVMTPVVDFAVAQPEIDPRRIAVMGISMGGALVPRAAAFERRPKILIANPGVLNWSELIFDQMRPFLGKDLVALLDRDPRAFDAEVAKLMKGDALLRWGVDDMAWKHGTRSPSQVLKSMRAYDNTDSVARITARTLVMDGTGDPWAQGKRLYEAVRAPKDYMLFTARDTGLMHVQNGALAVSVQRLFDWLDDHL